MTLQASGQISLDNLQTEFGGPSPISLFNYYRGGSYVPNTTNNNSIPASGGIALESFYNTESTITGAISGGGTISNTAGSAGFGLTASSNFNSPSYSWSTTAGSLSSTTAASVTLTLSAAASSTASATVTCVVSSSGKSTTLTVGCTYDNTTTNNETVSISGGRSVTSTTGGYTFNLSASGTPITPSAYSWSTDTGSLTSTTGATTSLSVTAAAGSSVTAHVTCVMTVSGDNYTATTACTYVRSCFSGCTRILTSEGYKRFDQLPAEFYVINHTGRHLAKLIVHENSTEPMRKMGNHLVTERHLMKVGESWVPARDIFHEVANEEPRTVYNCHVLTDNPEDHHYLLENGMTAHNIKS